MCKFLQKSRLSLKFANLETLTLLKLNDTISWLNSQPDKYKILAECEEQAPAVSQNSKDIAKKDQEYLISEAKKVF